MVRVLFLLAAVTADPLPTEGSEAGSSFTLRQPVASIINLVNATACSIMLAISFCGPMTPAAVKPLKAACAAAVNKQDAELTLLFGSAGGSIDVAFDLFHFLRALPLRLAIHNTGMVGSMATMVFLAGQVRRAAEEAVFLFHDMSWTYGEPQTVPATTLAEQSLLLDSARSRMKRVFRAHTSLDDERLERLQFMREPVILDARAALDAGIVHEVADPRLRFGTELHACDWP